MSTKTSGQTVTPSNQTTIEQRIATAQWMLERQLHWAAQAEVKVGAVVTIDIGMLAGLFAAYANEKSPSAWVNLFSVIFVLLIVLAVSFAAMALIPRLLPAAHKSGLFFGEIALLDAHEFVASTARKSLEEVLEDWLFQVHRNAQIANEKHRWVKKAMLISFLAAATWVVAVGCLIRL